MRGSLAQRLWRLRLERGLTLEEAAAQIGIDSHTLSRAERGIQKPQAPTLKKIAAGYTVPLEDLIAEPTPVPLAEAAPLEGVEAPVERRALARELEALIKRFESDVDALPYPPADKTQRTLVESDLWGHITQSFSLAKSMQIEGVSDEGLLSLESQIAMKLIPKAREWLGEYGERTDVDSALEKLASEGDRADAARLREW